MLLRLIISLGLIISLSACNPADVAEEGDQPRKVIFSTDFAIGLINGSLAGTRPGPSDADDAFAVALGLNAPEIDVLGLVITYGNNLTSPEMAVARTTLDVLGADIPIVAGATRPLANPGVELYSGQSMTSACLNDGVNFMAEQLDQHDAVTLIAIGPFTDVACLILNYPHKLSHIQELIILAGSKPGNPITISGLALPDLNFDSDPRAMEIILENSDIPITAMLFEVTSTTLVTNDQLASLAAHDNPVSQYFAAASKPHAENWTRALKQPGQVPWDSNPVWYLLNPEAYVCPEVGYFLKVGQPTTHASPDNELRFAPKFDTRKVRACGGFTSEKNSVNFISEILEAVGLE